MSERTSTRLVELQQYGTWVRAKLTESESGHFYKMEFVVASAKNSVHTCCISRDELETLRGDVRLDIYEEKLKKAFQFMERDNPKQFAVSISNDALTWREKNRLGSRLLGKIDLETCSNISAILKEAFLEGNSASKYNEILSEWQNEKEKILASREEALAAVSELETDLYYGFEQRCSEYESQLLYMEQAADIGYWKQIEEPPKVEESPSPSTRTRGRGRGRGRGSSVKTSPRSVTTTPIKRTRSSVVTNEISAKRQVILDDTSSGTADTVPDDEKSTVGGDSDKEEEMFIIKN